MARTRQLARKSCGGRPPPIPLLTSGGQGCRCRCRGGWESSLSRKRPRSLAQALPPLPRRTPQWYYSEDDDDDENLIIDEDDGRSHGRDDDDSEEDEQQSGSGEQRGSSRGDVSADGSDADDVARGAAVEQPAAEEEDSDDDDRPLSVVSPARTLVHGGSTSTAPAPAPALPESSPPAAPAPPESSATAPAPAPAPPELVSPSSLSDSSSVIRNVTLENSSTFDCSICYHPLRSPIFQCTVGHVVCSLCHDKLGLVTNCHVCRVPIPDGYFRCNVMEQVVDSIRVPCLHAAHGCAVQVVYHDRDAHARTCAFNPCPCPGEGCVPCPHAAHGCAEQVVYHDRYAHARTCAFKPCHCPSEGCGFAGAVQTTLLEHFAAVHRWPCSSGRTTTGTLTGFDVRLRKGFNVVVVTAGATTSSTEQQYTLVLNVKQEAPVCYTITAFCIHPSNTGTAKLMLSSQGRSPDSNLRYTYGQSSQRNVVFTDLSNGIPGRSSCYPFLVSRWSAQDGGDDDDIRVTVNNIGGI